MVPGSMENPEERRAEVRVDAAGTRIAKVSFRTNIQFVEAELVDTSSRGVGLRVAKSSAEDMRSGAEIVIRFDSKHDRRPVITKAGVRSLVDEGETLRIGAEFTSTDHFYPQLTDKLWTFFNRRSKFRVRTPKTMIARVIWPGSQLNLPMHDLSVDGVGINLTPEDVVGSPEEGPWRVTFRLPDVGKALKISLHCAHLTRRTVSQRIGFQFDGKETRDFGVLQKQVQQYVVEKQQETLQDEEE